MQVLQNIKPLQHIKKSDLPKRVVEEVFPLFEHHISTPFRKGGSLNQVGTRRGRPIAIAVSSGVDSMTLATLFILRSYQNQLPLKNIHIIHCNHNIRKQSTQEAEFIQTFFKGCTIHIPPKRNKYFPKDEKTLRQRRYQCFQKILKENAIQTLLLGHHLEDRIESTFLNCIRGAGLKGFLNMQTAQNNHPLLKIASCKVYRPLLAITKKQIITFCEQRKITYFEDETNAEPTTSQRNYIRNDIIKKLVNMNGKKSKFLESMKQMYEEIQTSPEGATHHNPGQRPGSSDLVSAGPKGNDITQCCVTPYEATGHLHPIPTFPSRKATYSYLWQKNLNSTQPKDLLALRNHLGIYYNIRSSQIQERYSRLTNTQS
ncbi:MAG: tRNA lysidine(34) synthetase TilS [Candidatus Peribacteria bacterium]|jgi:tRNA(Ile)-lysidine synthetase-like protein|nr:tRNA lysidine(34) synthetase TilS [Candidatus Peribacteria bacterium]